VISNWGLVIGYSLLTKSNIDNLILNIDKGIVLQSKVATG
jgi:hypothetical protein